MAAAFGKGSAVSLVFQPQAGGVECGIVLITHAPNSLAVPGAWCSVHGWIANHGTGALEIMMRDWGNMAERGTQTCWETFEYNDKNWTRSVAHAWSAARAVYLPEEILGIHPLEPGFKKFRVAPVAGDLEWARGSVATPHGPIYVAWQRGKDGTTKINYAAPEECERAA